MMQTKLKEFLNCGAFLQVAPDRFNLVLGPFKKTNLISSAKTLIYQPHFWDFLETNSQPNFLKGREEFVLERSEIMALLQDFFSQKPSLAWAPPTAEAFKIQFMWSQKKFQQNELKKTVPIISQSAQTKFNVEHFVYCLKNLFSEKKVGWSYGLWQEGQGFLGHTPELIVDWAASDQLLKTTALAGTFTKTQTAAQDLLKDSKNLEEHQIVVDDILQKLQSLSFVQDLKKDKTEAFELKYLVHLKTEFEAKVASIEESFRVIQALHPTAALGLFPCKKEAFQSLCELQYEMSRQNFAAPFAFLNSNSLFCVAAIRNFQFSPSKITLFSGCGVTNRSVYENELTELTNKRESVKKMMGLAD